MGCGTSRPNDMAIIGTSTKLDDITIAKVIEGIKKDDVYIIQKSMEKNNLKPHDIIGNQGSGITCLHLAANTNSFQVLQYLLDWLQVNQKANYFRIVNLKDYQGNTPLMIACFSNAVETTVCLVDKGDINYQQVNNSKLNTKTIAYLQNNPTIIGIINKFDTKPIAYPNTPAQPWQPCSPYAAPRVSPASNTQQPMPNANLQGIPQVIPNNNPQAMPNSNPQMIPNMNPQMMPQAYSNETPKQIQEQTIQKKVVMTNKIAMETQEQSYTEQPIQKYSEQPMQSYTEQPIQRYSEQPMQRQGEQPIQRESEQPIQIYREQPLQRQGEQPMQIYSEQPIQRESEKPIQIYSEQPMQRQGEQPIQQYSEQPMQNYMAKPIQSQMMQSPIQHLNQEQVHLESKKAENDLEQIKAKLNKTKVIVDNDTSIFKGIDSNSGLYQVLQTCQQNMTNYIDPTFPHNVSSICKNAQHPLYNLFQNASWRRVSEIMANQQLVLYDEISPNDIKAGILGPTKFLSLLYILAEYPSKLQKVLINKLPNTFGAYGVTFYSEFKKVEIIIDDYFPCNHNGYFMFSTPTSPELWVLILEKAYAKFIGDYVSSQDMPINEISEQILGQPARLQNILSKSDIYYLLDAIDDKCIVSLEVKMTDKDTQGLVIGRTYTILEYADGLDGEFIFKLRDPWGDSEWKGAFSDQSPKLTPELKNKLTLVEADDGIFCMCDEDIIEYFGWFYSIYAYDTHVMRTLDMVSDPLTKYTDYFELEFPKWRWPDISEVKGILLFTFEPKIKTGEREYTKPLWLVIHEADGRNFSSFDYSKLGNIDDNQKTIFYNKRTTQFDSIIRFRFKFPWNDNRSHKWTVSLFSLDVPVQIRKSKPNPDFKLKFFEKSEPFIMEKGEYVFAPQEKPIGPYYGYYIENCAPNKRLIITVNVTNLHNMKLCKYNRVDDSTFVIKVDPYCTGACILKALGDNPTHNVQHTVAWQTFE